MVDGTLVAAREIMQTDVVRLHAGTPIDRAVATFEEYQISGAPVVDEAGKIVGVLSASNIISVDHVREDGIEFSGTYYHLDPLDAEDGLQFESDDYDTAVLERESVGDWMTPKVISVHPESTLQNVCEIMAREGIHRVFVVENDELKGVISSFDVVRYLAGPVD